MKKISHINLMLATLAIALALILWYKPGKNPAYHSLTDLDPNSIQQIKIIEKGQLKYHLQRINNEWKSQPDNASTQEKVINGLLNIARLNSIYHFPIAGKQLADFGLQDPRWIVQLNNTSISFGSSEPMSQLRYALTDDTIHLVGDGFQRYLIKSPLEPLK